MRAMFFNIPNIDAFINKRTVRYVGKTARSDDAALPRKFLIAWINKPRKNGVPQLSCNQISSPETKLYPIAVLLLKNGCL
jgi:hypothetical protein